MKSVLMTLGLCLSFLLVVGIFVYLDSDANESKICSSTEKDLQCFEHPYQEQITKLKDNGTTISSTWESSRQ